MTTPAQEAPFVLPAVAFRPVRLGIICLVLAGLAAGLSAYLEHPMFGLFFAVGLAMGLSNALLIRRAVTNITAKDHPLKSQMAVNSAVRLLVMSVVGLAIAYKWAPEGGLGTLFGIALFEALLVATTSLPVLKKLRAGAAEDAATAANDG